MAKAIIPKKLIIEINDDGTFKNGILQYRLAIDGVTDETKYYSVGIDDGMDTTQFIQPLIDSQTVALNAEQIDVESSPVILALQAQQTQISQKVSISKGVTP